MKIWTSVIAIMWIGGVSTLGAHPHMWIDSQAVPVMSATRIERIDVTWSLDLGFTQMVLLDYDTNKNGRIDQAEIKAIHDQAFSNLVHYNFFSRIVWNNTESPIVRVENFTARTDTSGKLIYAFSLPINRSIPTDGLVLDIYQYDPSFFADIVFTPGTPMGEHLPAISIQLEPAPEHRFFDGTITPRRMRLRIGKALTSQPTSPQDAAAQTSNAQDGGTQGTPSTAGLGQGMESVAWANTELGKAVLAFTSKKTGAGPSAPTTGPNSWWRGLGNHPILVP